MAFHGGASNLIDFISDDFRVFEGFRCLVIYLINQAKRTAERPVQNIGNIRCYDKQKLNYKNKMFWIDFTRSSKPSVFKHPEVGCFESQDKVIHSIIVGFG